MIIIQKKKLLKNKTTIINKPVRHFNLKKIRSKGNFVYNLQKKSFLRKNNRIKKKNVLY